MNNLFRLQPYQWRLLLRGRLTLMVTASTLVGYLLCPTVRVSLAGLWAGLAVALLCSGCTVLNQIQERHFDRLMSRTAERPLASGALSLRSAGILAVVLMVSAFVWLSRLSPVAPLLGCFSVFWYNGLYTPLKQHTSLAVLPGALCGAVPPLIGWSVAGGSLLHPSIGLLCGLLILWQVPHFLLFVSRHRQDYRRAGLPVFAEQMSEPALRRILSVWLAAVASSFLLLPAFGLLQGVLGGGVLLVAVGLLLATWQLGRQQEWGRLFGQLNMHMGIVLLLLACDRLLALS